MTKIRFIRSFHLNAYLKHKLLAHKKNRSNMRQPFQKLFCVKQKKHFPKSCNTRTGNLGIKLIIFLFKMNSIMKT